MSSSPDRWPAWATAPIELVPADPSWPRQAATLIARVTPLLASIVHGPVLHVGSTAVPGLAAKPVLDLLAPVTALDGVRGATEAAQALSGDGWALIPPDLDDRPWRRAWVLPVGGRRRAHLHLVVHDHPQAAAEVRFRDALRADAGRRDRYAALKRRLAAAHRDDREAYTAGKSTFVAEVLGRPA